MRSHQGVEHLSKLCVDNLYALVLACGITLLSVRRSHVPSNKCVRNSPKSSGVVRFLPMLFCQVDITKGINPWLRRRRVWYSDTMFDITSCKNCRYVYDPCVSGKVTSKFTTLYVLPCEKRVRVRRDDPLAGLRPHVQVTNSRPIASVCMRRTWISSG